MKAFAVGMLGAVLVGVAFVGGTIWRSQMAARPFARFEMQVAPNGDVTRMDRITGVLETKPSGKPAPVEQPPPAPAPFARYEMHVTPETITRLDRIYGTLHTVTTNGTGDLLEYVPAKPSPSPP